MGGSKVLEQLGGRCRPAMSQASSHTVDMCTARQQILEPYGIEQPTGAGRTICSFSLDPSIVISFIFCAVVSWT